MYDACSDCVVVWALGDLVTWRHFVRGLEGAAQRFIIKLACKWGIPNFGVLARVVCLEIKGQTR